MPSRQVASVMDRVASLYQCLGTPVDRCIEPGRTEYTAQVETMDHDRALDDLFCSLSSRVQAAGASDGRTEETRAIETIDRDRVAGRPGSALLKAPHDLYRTLGTQPRADTTPGRTELTESVETIDWDRPPEW